MVGDKERKRMCAAEIVERTKLARIRQGLTQEEVAKTLGIDVSKYKKYEQETPIPHYLIHTFCLITNISIEHLIAGRDRRRVIPMRKPQLVE